MNDASAPAGWYPDPQAADRNRYWDGAAWTQATTPRADASPPAASAGWADPPSVSEPGRATPPAWEQPASPAPQPAWGEYPSAANPSPPAWANGPQIPVWGQQPYGTGPGSPAPGLPAYYEHAFATIDSGRTKVVWNWAAFLLGALWYLYRGMWVKAILYVAVAFLSGGFLAIPIWIYGGLMGTYDLWLLHRKGTQGW